MIRFLMIVSLLLVLSLIGCGGGVNTGGGTETGDPGDMNSPEFSGGLVSGKVSLDEQDTISLEGASIWLDGDSQLLKKSRSGGVYTVDGLSLGAHELFVSWTSGDVVLMGKSDIFDIGQPTSASQKPRIYLGQTIIVGVPSSIQGLVQSADNSELTIKLTNSIYVKKSAANTGFDLTDIPFGKYTIEIYQRNEVKISKEIELLAGEVFDLGILTIE